MAFIPQVEAEEGSVPAFIPQVEVAEGSAIPLIPEVEVQPAGGSTGSPVVGAEHEGSGSE